MPVDDTVSDPSLRLALDTSHRTREQVIALLDVVSASPLTASPSEELQLQVSKQQKQLLTYLSHLRGLHRDAHAGSRETKALTAEMRQEVDKLHLHLQNLYYEQRHLQGEISACESYEYVAPP
jgi:THO complex subunit 5